MHGEAAVAPAPPPWCSYINGKPFVVREAERPFSNLEYTGIDRERVEDMEGRLKADVLAEAALYGSQVLVAHEDDQFQARMGPGPCCAPCTVVAGAGSVVLTGDGSGPDGRTAAPSARGPSGPGTISAAGCCASSLAAPVQRAPRCAA